MALISTFANGSKPSFCIKDTHLKGIDLDDVWYVRVLQAPTTNDPNATHIIELLNDEGAPFMQEDEAFESGAPYENEEYGTAKSSPDDSTSPTSTQTSSPSHTITT